jgi:hypothetical protein
MIPKKKVVCLPADLFDSLHQLALEDVSFSHASQCTSEEQTTQHIFLDKLSHFSFTANVRCLMLFISQAGMKPIIHA